MYCDYHLHSKFSFDSNEEPESICEAAIERGVEEICFTEHFEFGAPVSDIWPDIGIWNNTIDELREKYEGRLSILQGIESGQPYKEPDRANRLMEQLQDRLDFVIGSVHIVGDTGRPSKYVFSQDNYQEYFKTYFEELLLLAETGDFDVMGHVTFPFRYVPEQLLREWPIESFEKQFRDVFDILIRRNKGIEINTSGYRTGLSDAMPSENLVRWYKEQGGKIITVGSDGHSARSACLNIDRGYQLFKNLGFQTTTKYQKRDICYESDCDNTGKKWFKRVKR